MHKSTAAACDVLVFWQMALGRSSLRITLLNALMAAEKKKTSLFILSLLGTVNTSLLARLRDLASCK